MTLYEDFTQRIKNALQETVLKDKTDCPTDFLDRVSAEAPRDPDHGDLATNAALVLAKPLGMPPRDIATRLALELERDESVASVEVAGPGFINMRLSKAYWAHQLSDILKSGEKFGYSSEGAGKAVNVEYVSANPTGPMHVGHCRGAVVGDAIANMLVATGYDVTREYYINDAGAQVDSLARSVYLRYKEALGQEIGDIPAGLYPGDYLVPIGQALAEEFSDQLLDQSEDQWLPVVRDRAVSGMMDLIRDDLDGLNVRHDLFFSEKTLQMGDPSAVDLAIAAFREKGLVYQGSLPPPKGQPSDDWEDREQTLFRSSDYGDDVDRPLVKSDGSYTYFASDIAYHYDKFQRGFLDQIDVLGADHGGYVKRMKAAVRAFSDNQAQLEMQLCQLVKLFRDGVPFTMSKRSGDLVTARDVVDEVGVDAVRFMMLYRKADAPLDFDFKLVTEQSKDNPVFYVQYAHARTCSVLRQAAEEVPEIAITIKMLASADLTQLADEGETRLIRAMADWPRMLHSAAQAREPHRIAFYCYELASLFHGHWNQGKELPQLRFIKPNDIQTTSARLALVSAVGAVLRSGLGILGVSAPQEMR